MSNVANVPRERPDIGELYRRYGGLVLRRVRRFYGAAEAHDVMQEVFARAIEKIDSFRGDSSAGTWLYQIATRHCLNRLRDEKRRQQLFLENEPAAYWSPQIASANQEREIVARQLLGEVDEELALIGLYYYVDGMSHAEIAEMVGLSRRTIGNRLVELELRVRQLSGET